MVPGPPVKEGKPWAVCYQGKLHKEMNMCPLSNVPGPARGPSMAPVEKSWFKASILWTIHTHTHTPLVPLR